MSVILFEGGLQFQHRRQCFKQRELRFFLFLCCLKLSNCLFVLLYVAIESLEFMNSVYAKWQTQEVQVSSVDQERESYLCIWLQYTISKVYPTHAGWIYIFETPVIFYKPLWWWWWELPFSELQHCLLYDMPYSYKNCIEQSVTKLWNIISITNSSIFWEFPGDPVVRIQCIHFYSPRFSPWSRN